MTGARVGCGTCVHGWAAGHGGVGQAGLALPARIVSEADVDGDIVVIAARASLTERARAEICRRVGEDGASVAAVAREFGISWRTAMVAVREHGQRRVDDPARLADIDTLRMDETAFQAACVSGATSFVTGIVDLTRGPGPARLLDIVADRSAFALISSINERDSVWRAGIVTAALDPYRGYASALGTALGTALPDAVRVLDAFHVVRLAFATVDEVRRRIQREHTGHRGRRDDSLYGIRRLLRRSHDHHSEHSWERLLAGLDAGDTHDEQLTRTWVATQDLRLIYHSRARARADGLLYRWLTYCADANIPELTRLARTIDSWRTELLAYFDTGGVSNGPTEATNLLIKKSNVSDTDSATSTTTGSAYSYTAASTGTLSAPPRSEAGYHAQRRRATFLPTDFMR
jgi:transposase